MRTVFLFIYSLITNKICQAVNVIKRIMDKKKYALCQGYIYKKVPEGMHTYVYCSTVKDFLLYSMANHEVAEVVTGCLSNITYLLSQPSCRLVKPLKIDFNLIEVLLKVFRMPYKKPENYSSSQQQWPIWPQEGY